MKKTAVLLLCAVLVLSAVLAGCSGKAAEKDETAPAAQTQNTAETSTPVEKNDEEQENTEQEKDDTQMKMQLEVNGKTFTATLEENAATEELVRMMQAAPVVIDMRDYAGFEKVGSLGRNLPANDCQTTTHAGDIVLYQGDQIVIFYGSNSWSYTRLGHIDNLNGWEEALGSGSVTVTFSLAE